MNCFRCPAIGLIAKTARTPIHPPVMNQTQVNAPDKFSFRSHRAIAPADVAIIITFLKK